MTLRLDSGATGITVLALAVAADTVLGEPPACCHPVVAMGRVIAEAERRAPAAPWPAFAYGACIAVGGTLGCWLVARFGLQAIRQNTLLVAALVEVLALKSAFSVRALDDAASAVADALAARGLATARQDLRALVSRDTTNLPAPLLAAAAVESVAENLSDSFIAPLFWYAVLGVPGAVAYRFVNTCDAMLGYHGRLEYLGKAAARLDDVANWLPARLSGLLLVLAARLSNADARAAWRIMWRHHCRTASPNAGWPMSATAGALGVRLEKTGHYALGDGAAPTPSTVLDAICLMRRAAALAALCYFAFALARGPRVLAA